MVDWSNRQMVNGERYTRLSVISYMLYVIRSRLFEIHNRNKETIEVVKGVEIVKSNLALG